MAEITKVRKLQSSLLVFFQSNQEKKKSWMLAKKEVNYEKIIKCPRFEQNVLHKKSWVSDNQI